MNNTNRRGFTIVELVIVIAVIAILAAALIPTFGNVIENAQNSAAMQEALGAYTEFIIDYADEGVIPEYLFYKKENKVVVIKNGAALSVHENEEEAIKEVLDNPETSEDESAGYTLNTLKIDGLYFVQSNEETECNHSYVSVVTAPTCVNDGYTTHTCSFCSDSYTDSETPATNEHSYIDGKCECGVEKNENEVKIVASIGYPEKEGGCFNLVTTPDDGVYEAIIKRGNTNSPVDDRNFVYFADQLMDDDIPEAIQYKTSSNKGFVLKIGSDKTHGTIDTVRSIKDPMILELFTDNEYRLTLDFTNMTWYVEEIE